MYRLSPTIAIFLLAACNPPTPDDRVIEVISDTGPGSSATAEPIEPAEEIETRPIETTPVASEPVVDTSAQCDEDNYKHLVGQAAGGTQFPVGPRLRVFGTNDIITQELVPQRTNIVVDDSGKIVRVYCG